MNDRAEEMITQSAEKVLEWMEAGEGFAVEQAPMLAQEIVRWGVWGNLGGMFYYGSIFLFILGFVYWTFRRKSIREWIFDETGGALYLVHIISIFIMALLGEATLHSGSQALKALVAPRLYIIEQIGGLL